MSDGQPNPYPNDISAEKAVLRAILMSTEAITDVVEILTEHDFYRPAHALIYQSALTLYGNGENPNPITVAANLSKNDQLHAAGGMDYVTALATSSTGKGWRREAERVQALSVLRRTKEAAAHVENLATEGNPDDIDRIADIAQAEILAATVRRRTGLPPTYSLGEIMEDVLDEVEAIGSKNHDHVPGLPTGFTDLDSLTGGGLRPGQLIVLAARPAMGSSTLSLDLLRTTCIKNGVPAALFTWEQSRQEIAMRITAAESRVGLHHLRAGTLNDDWTRMARRMPDISAAPLYI